MRNTIRSVTIVLALFAGIGLAAAQSGPPKSDKSDQAGKQEPTAKPAQNTNDGVFVNGKLNVPGAPENTDTVPAKFSAKNSADDKLITVAYTFKQLTDDERRAIYDAVKGQQTSGAGGRASYDVGAELPASIDLAPFPPEVTAKMPQLEKYRYTVSGNRVLLVSPANMIVVGTIDG
jgi:hypothetical protein